MNKYDTLLNDLEELNKEIRNVNLSLRVLKIPNFKRSLFIKDAELKQLFRVLWKARKLLREVISSYDLL